jgi:hypothetical protein
MLKMSNFEKHLAFQDPCHSQSSDMQQKVLQLNAYTTLKFICVKIWVFTVPEMIRQPSVAELWLASTLKDYARTHHKCFQTLCFVNNRMCEYDLVVKIGQSREG